MPLASGSRVGPYEILSLLGTGGMGEVWRARDTKLNRDVALKVLPEVFAVDADRLMRFKCEAQVLASLNHPNIAAIYGLEESDGVHALVLELVEGPTLADLVARTRTQSLPVDEVLSIARQIADALEAAHEHGVVHRDLKPANVKVRGDGAVKVLDFGLAKALDDEAESDRSTSPTMTAGATRAGIILGTVQYMSPEQARGTTVDRRTDIWAFGCVLYELLTGRQAFGGDTVSDGLVAVLTREPDWTKLPPDLPAPIRRVLDRCLQKEPKRRLRDLADIQFDLDEASAGSSALQPLGSEVRRSSFLQRAAWLGGAAVLAAIAFVVGGWWSTSRQPTPVEWRGERLGGSNIAMGPRISPDGQTLAFQATVDGLTQVAVMKPQSGNWTILTRDRTRGPVFDIAWSRDGTRLFFARYLGGPRGIFTVPVLGGEERLLLEDAMGPEPLPDGTLLVTRINTERVSQLYHFWPETGRLQALPASRLISSGVRIFADGREAVFLGRPLQGDRPAEHLFVIDLVSGRVRRIAPAVDILPILTVDFFPLAVGRDGRSVLFNLPVGNLHRIVSVPRDGSQAVRSLVTLTEQPYVLDVGVDGSLYVDQIDRPQQLFRFSATSGGLERGVPHRRDMAAGFLPLPDGRILRTERIVGRDHVGGGVWSGSSSVRSDGRGSVWSPGHGRR